MISLAELNPHNYETTPETDSNLHTLLERINLVRAAWGKSMTITSGLRSEADQMRINPKAPKSNHRTGSACDVLDTDGSLYAWCKANEQTLIDSKLWCEEGTKGWVHFQIIPPHSGKRWFLP